MRFEGLRFVYPSSEHRRTFSEKGMTKRMHMRHMYISIAAVTVRLLIMAVLLSSLFPDSYGMKA